MRFTILVKLTAKLSLMVADCSQMKKARNKSNVNIYRSQIIYTAGNFESYSWLIHSLSQCSSDCNVIYSNVGNLEMNFAQ
mmetsp:Transcript_20032/g.33765  ORF Transcript_20032/g.33765 Transcript_20032/m.33765 type:complete len:80 (-) Transcript_20032:1-240(-)